MLTVLRAGPSILLQDLGRYGVAHFGLSQGGPMDLHAFCWANTLLNNPPNASCLEITLGLCAFQFQSPTDFTLCGADANSKLNDASIQHWQTHRANAGDVLTISGFKSGNYLYLAVKDGFKVPNTLNSQSTVIRNQLGGLYGDGLALQNQDELPYQIHTQPLKMKALSTRHIPNYNANLTLHVLPSYQFHQFEAEAKATFFQSGYTVTQKCNRMGYCLNGAPINSHLNGVISEGIVLGAIQITNAGQPIVLMSDRQTIGGYPKMGVVMKTDLFRFSQARFGQQIHFKQGHFDVANLKWRKFRQFFGVQC
ncbi:biotin-dependent carboxyltransferase family protein [Thaumasiovibrio subtropicus]|uniref:5-oxoprolinase subunit C family protein n=1 Tax=Thaumasiovibrio subtropicus TaxID=1891207 RepID=UPI000B34F5D1|nr:biotin-dependent carboxyltransferase family protein [Thaumasiovibrio subtropicus]